MTATLSNEDKLSLVMQHMRSVDFQIYGTELDLIEANAVSEKDTQYIASLNSRLTQLQAKRSALVTEQESLTE